VRRFDPDRDALTREIRAALAENGTIWWLRLRGSHVLTVGVTGAGKASVIWAIIAGLVPFIRAGLVNCGSSTRKAGSKFPLAGNYSPARPRRRQVRRRLREQPSPNWLRAPWL
jgi:hypothetical protein